MSASRTTQKELLGLLARIAAACETADSIVPTGLDELYDEIIATLDGAGQWIDLADGSGIWKIHE